MAPIILSANQPPDRFYRGGSRISAFRASPPCSSHQPEDWVASTTCCAGCESSRLGMSRLPDGSFLADCIASDPERWLGRDHVGRHGADTKLLFKLLDAGQRLPVHAHPHVAWARRHLDPGARHGKAEAWYVLTAGTVYLGLREAVGEDELLRLVTARRGGELLGRMHAINVEPHQTVYVPPGTLHAIGEGILLAEVQEPSDLSVLVEWVGFDIDGLKDGHLGVGFEQALTAVDRAARTREEIMALVKGPGTNGNVFAAESEAYFRLERLKVSGRERCARGFAVVVVLEGTMNLVTESGVHVSVQKGTTAVVPFSDGHLTWEGSSEVLIARPPL